MRASISGWALDTAAEHRGRAGGLRKVHRSRVLTATDPTQVLRLLAEAFDAFGDAASESQPGSAAVSPR